VGSFALALVLRGTVDVCATVVDSPATRIEQGAILRAKGSLDAAIPLRLVCATDEAEVATWDEVAVEQALKACPWVEEELQRTADRAMALAGATMGPLGDRLDDTVRRAIAPSFELQTLHPGDVLVSVGDPVPGIVVIGAGSLLVEGEGESRGALTSGDFLYSSEVLGRAPSPLGAKAGPTGALLLVAPRKNVQELVLSYPPLLEILTMG
jgi:hypothetical protein